MKKSVCVKSDALLVVTFPKGWHAVGYGVLTIRRKFQMGGCCKALTLSVRSNDLQQCQVLVSAMVEAFEKVSTLIERSLI